MFEFFIKPYFHNLIKIINMFILIEKFLLIAIQPSFGTAGIIGLITPAMILSSRINFKNFAKFDKKIKLIHRSKKKYSAKHSRNVFRFVISVQSFFCVFNK